MQRRHNVKQTNKTPAQTSPFQSMCVGSLECPGRRSLHCSGVCLPESSAAVHVCVGRSIGRDNKINKLWQAGRSRDIPFHNSVQQFDCSSPHLLSSKEKPLFSSCLVLFPLSQVLFLRKLFSKAALSPAMIV